MMNINILFMGSSRFSIPILDALKKSYDVKAVICQPDKPTGRGKKVAKSIIKDYAENYNLPVFQPQKLSKEENYFIQKYQIDLIVVAAYGKILPEWFLEFPKNGAVNIHASLLPMYRGASPIQAAILNGDVQTGITIIKMDSGMDTGDIISQRTMGISFADTTMTLSHRLSVLGAQLLIETLEDYVNGKIALRKQDSNEATYTKLIKKTDGYLDFNKSAVELERKIRAFDPWPVCFYEWEKKHLRVFKAEIHKDQHLLPFQHSIINKYPVVGTSTNPLVLLEVQPPGRGRMDGKAFLSGAQNWISP